MDLIDALLPFLGPPSKARTSGCRVVALVGAGGKTAAMFALAAGLAARGGRVIATTTTNILDPRLEKGRRFDRLILESALADTPRGAPTRDIYRCREGVAAGEITVIASRADAASGKLRGIHPAWVPTLSAIGDFMIVEADGARGLSIKAPAAYEPVLPPRPDLVLGIVGLDCIGAPMNERMVHRPELLGPVVGCGAGDPLRPEHILALTAAPGGLFKGAPAGTARVLLLNKADMLKGIDPDMLIRIFALAALPPADMVLICSLADPVPERRVRVYWRVGDGGIFA